MPVNIDKNRFKPITHLEFIAKQVVEGFITGLHKSPFHGFSVEFAEHRFYNAGESIKNIDWKLYARTDKLFVKRFEEETNLRCQLIIDISSSMYFPVKNKIDVDDMNKIMFSVYSAAAIIEILKKQCDAFGLTLFSDKIEIKTQVKSSEVHVQNIYSELERLIQNPLRKKPAKTNVINALHEIAENIHKRSLIVLFSDMFDDIEQADELFSALQHLKYNKHEVILFHVVDKATEIDFNFHSRPYKFVDTETGEELKLNPFEIREKYQSVIKKYKEDLKMKCQQYKIEFISADIDEGFIPVLQSYFIKRIKMQ